MVAVDLGTTVSVVAARPAAGAPRIVAVDGEHRSPSVVAVDGEGTLHAGRAAQAIARRWPERAFRAPARHLGEKDPAVMAGQPWALVDLVAALIRGLTGAAGGEAGGILHLPYPAGWGTARRERLAEAARRGGAGEVVLVPAVVAAVAAHGAIAPLEPGQVAAVLVLGATSAQAGVVRAGEGGFPELVSPPVGRDGLGADRYDEVLAGALAARLGTDVANALAWSDAPGWAAAAVALGGAARVAKEQLSLAPHADVTVDYPDGRRQLRITRAEFEELIRPHAVRAVRTLRRAVIDAGIGPGQLAAVHLAGGGAAVPLIGRLAAQALGGVEVVRHPDPAAAIAAGATLADMPAGAAHDWDAVPSPGRWAPPVPSPAGPRQAAAATAAPGYGPAAPPGAHPVDGDRPAPGAAPPSGRGTPGAARGAAPGAGRGAGRRLRRGWVIAATVAVVAAGGTAGAVLATRGGGGGGQRPPLDASQLSPALLTAGDVTAGFSSTPSPHGCGSPPTPAASAAVVLSNPGYGQITNEVRSYTSVSAATQAEQTLQASAAGCLGSTATTLVTVADAPTVCQSSWVGNGPVEVNGNAQSTATGYAAVYRCGRAVGDLLIFPEQPLAFLNAGVFQIVQAAGAKLDALNP